MRLFSALVAASMLLSAIPAFAIEDHQYSIGAGLNFNKPNSEGDLGAFEETVSATLSLAGKALLKINDSVAFRTGLGLQQKSAKFDVDVLGVEGDVSYIVTYASVPLTLQVEANKHISFFGGYIADIRLSDDCDAGGDFDECSVEKNSESIVHIATAGMAIDVNDKFSIDLSYQHGLTDVVKDTFKINTFSAMFFYKF